MDASGRKSSRPLTLPIFLHIYNQQSSFPFSLLFDLSRLVINLIIVAILELGTGFVQTYSAFLAVRSLFGIGMGGIWGLAAANALENMPVEPRGLFSGLLQEGYAVC